MDVEHSLKLLVTSTKNNQKVKNKLQTIKKIAKSEKGLKKQPTITLKLLAKIICIGQMVYKRSKK